MKTLAQLNDTELLAIMHEVVGATFATTLGKKAGEPVSVTAKMGEFPDVAFRKFLAYGFQRVFNDKVGGTINGVPVPLADKLKAAQDLVARFKRGEIGRAESEGLTDITYESRIIAANLLRKHKADEWKALKDADRKTLNARLDGIIADARFADDIRAEAEAVLKRKADERARAEKLAGKLVDKFADL
jgi:hypothetical protein